LAKFTNQGAWLAAGAYFGNRKKKNISGRRFEHANVWKPL
jgi:hypothetical protein